MSNVNENLVKLLSGEDIRSPFLKIEKGVISIKNLSSIKGLQFEYQGNAQFSSIDRQIYARLSLGNLAKSVGSTAIGTSQNTSEISLSNKLVTADGQETSWFISASNKTGKFILASLAGESLLNTIDDEIKIVNFVSDKKFRITSAIIVESKDKSYRIGLENIIVIDKKYYKQSSNFDSISFEWNDIEEDNRTSNITTTNFDPTEEKEDVKKQNIKIGDIANVSSYTSKV